MTNEETAISNYLKRTGFAIAPITTALIDMDGVLYDSMPHHSLAWKRLGGERGWTFADNEFFLYEGMTGAAIIRLMEKRCNGREDLSDEECKEIYAKKAAYFTALGEVSAMDSADKMLQTLRDNNCQRVLVTGSGQATLLERLNNQYPGIFTKELMVTAHDVKHGKPDPEPYIMGMKKSQAEPQNCIVVENAPLGVRAGSASQCFTVGLTTGPVPAESLKENGADIVYPSMKAFAEALPLLLELRNNH